MDEFIPGIVISAFSSFGVRHPIARHIPVSPDMDMPDYMQLGG